MDDAGAVLQLRPVSHKNRARFFSMANITINIAHDLKKKVGNLSCTVCVTDMNDSSNQALAVERCAVIFLRDQTHDFHLTDNKLGEKHPLDLKYIKCGT